MAWCFRFSVEFKGQSKPIFGVGQPILRGKIAAIGFILA
jgi:hypothetical protein